jgi:hypothetical protein
MVCLSLELIDPYQSAIDALTYPQLFDKQHRIKRESNTPGSSGRMDKNNLNS